MKIRVNFKTPDVLYDIESELDNAATEAERVAMENTIYQFVKYGECVRVEFDSDKGTATVLKAT
jgi:hypothetical protein